MHNKVVYRIARGLRRAGAAVLRFNYRGVNLSEGDYAHGKGELEDARTALLWLRDRYPNLPVTLAGFSFGSRIVLELACGGDLGGIQPRRVIAVGFPTVYQRSLLPRPLHHSADLRSKHARPIWPPRGTRTVGGGAAGAQAANLDRGARSLFRRSAGKIGRENRWTKLT